VVDCVEELDGGRTQGFIQVRAARMRNTLQRNTLHPVFANCIAWESYWTCFGGSSLPPLYKLGGRVTEHVRSILVGYTRSFPGVYK
jgi:hypothetical protein